MDFFFLAFYRRATPGWVLVTFVLMVERFESPHMANHRDYRVAEVEGYSMEKPLTL